MCYTLAQTVTTCCSTCTTSRPLANRALNNMSMAILVTNCRITVSRLAALQHQLRSHQCFASLFQMQQTFPLQPMDYLNDSPYEPHSTTEHDTKNSSCHRNSLGPLSLVASCGRSFCLLYCLVVLLHEKTKLVQHTSTSSSFCHNLRSCRYPHQ